MKIIIVIFPLLLSSSIIYHTHSFSSVHLRQETSVSVMSEEEALIAISYDEMNKSFTLKNNTENTIKVANIQIEGNGSVSSFNPFIMAGDSNVFFVEGDSLELVGLLMKITIDSENKAMEITSTLPQFIIAEEGNLITENAENTSNPKPSNTIEFPTPTATNAVPNETHESNGQEKSRETNTPKENRLAESLNIQNNKEDTNNVAEENKSDTNQAPTNEEESGND